MIMHDGGNLENIVLQAFMDHIRLRVREQRRLYFVPWLMKRPRHMCEATFGLSVNYKDLLWCDG